jgi:signal transduction histidine kinase
LLARRIVGPVGAASRFAELIAAGKLDAEVPRGSADELGTLLASMGTMRDNIKAMMECEVAQRRSAQARLADALESSQEGVVLVDVEDRIAIANAQAANLFGVSSDLLNPGTPIANLKSALEVKGSFAAGQVLMPCDGDNEAAVNEEQISPGRWLRIGRSATRDDGYIFVCSDITERKKAEKELIHHRDQLQELVDSATQELKAKAEELKKALAKEKELNEQQRQFVSMASHEFRTPLSIIDGSVQNLARNSENITADYLLSKTGKIRDAVVRMTQLMESTLSLARMHEGKIKVEIEACDIGKVLRKVCVRQQEVSKDHVISCNLADLPATVQADSSSLDQVFTNLLSNAVKYAPDAPDIEVMARTECDTVVVEVRDYGLGIDEGDLPGMFERFFRAKTSTGIAGTGIGLNLVKSFVEMHGGTVNVESKKGEGSTFTVRLPVAGPDQSEQADTWAA